MGFQDTFTKGDKSEQNLDYDDSAFYYFFTAVLLVILVPWTYSLIKTGLFGQKSLVKVKGKNCECSDCKFRIGQGKERLKKAGRTFGLYFKIFIVMALWYAVYLMIHEISNEKTIKGFNPYEILEIDTDADDRAIKKAYRKAGLKYHPDKNPDDSLASSKFMLITKAYEALTDETARNNYIKYGNPDGPGALQVAIGLPSFLLKRENQVPVLIIFFVMIIIVIPGSFLYWYQDAGKYDQTGVLIQTKANFYEKLNENMILKGYPRVLCYAAEFKKGVSSREEEEELNRLHKEIIDHIPNQKAVAPMFQKASVLIYAYLLHCKIPEILKPELDYVLKTSPRLIDGLLSLIVEIPKSREYKNMGLRTFLNAIDFSQLMIQGRWPGDSSLLILPHVDTDVAKN